MPIKWRIKQEEITWVDCAIDTSMPSPLPFKISNFHLCFNFDSQICIIDAVYINIEVCEKEKRQLVSYQFI